MISNEYEDDDDGGLAYRDLKEPEGWRFSSLRNILLLRFRILLTSRGWTSLRCYRREGEGEV
jgi:hypothetical protein